MVPEPVRTYLIHDLEAAPLVLTQLLASRTDWDHRPDPDRFSLREMLAHLADWEEIWLMRVKRITSERNPFLPSIDEGQMAIDRKYATVDPQQSLERYRTGRLALVQAIKDLHEDDWDRPAQREFVGDIDFLQQIAMIVGHDGYHMKQALVDCK